MEFSITEETKGKRLDLFLQESLTDVTRSYLKTLIEKQLVLVNGEVKKAGYALKIGDRVAVTIPPDREANIAAQDIPLHIVYEDEDMLIVDKEKGMVVHPANGNYEGTMVNALMHSHRDKLSSINGVIRPGIVHRIDKDTSGILVVAKNDTAHKKLSEQFKVHSIHRKYVALVKGVIKEDTLTISYPIGRSHKDRKKMAVTYQNSKEAVTHIQVLKRFYHSNATLVEATLETGRTHQIRVHLSYLNHPLVGDEIYGKKDGKWKVEGQMLHAKMLGLIHPTSGEYMEFESPLPDDFEKIVTALENKEDSNT